MSLPNSSRRQRVSEIKSEKKLIYAVILGITAVFLLFFYGVPALINMSVFISGLNHKNAPAQAQNPNSVVLFPPTLQPLPEATNSATIDVSGIADKNEKITLFRADQQLDTQDTKDNGRFLFPNVNLNPGQNYFTAAAQDAKGNKSSNSSSVSIFYKNTPPKLEINSPQDNASIISDNKFVVVSGKTDPQSTISVNDHIAVVNPDGSFSYQQSLNDGDNTLKITAQDNAGNQTSTEIHVKYSSS